MMDAQNAPGVNGGAMEDDRPDFNVNDNARKRFIEPDGANWCPMCGEYEGCDGTCEDDGTPGLTGGTA